MHRLAEQQSATVDHLTRVDTHPDPHPADRPRLGQHCPLHVQRGGHGRGGIVEGRETAVAFALIRREPPTTVTDHIPHEPREPDDDRRRRSRVALPQPRRPPRPPSASTNRETTRQPLHLAPSRIPSPARPNRPYDPTSDPTSASRRQLGPGRGARPGFIPTPNWRDQRRGTRQSPTDGLRSGEFPPLVSVTASPHTVPLQRLGMSDRPRDLVAVSGLCPALPCDYLTKVSGRTNIYIYDERIGRFPAPLDHPAIPYVLLRRLRLNCITRDYSALWEGLMRPGSSATCGRQPSPAGPRWALPKPSGPWKRRCGRITSAAPPWWNSMRWRR